MPRNGLKECTNITSPQRKPKPIPAPSPFSIKDEVVMESDVTGRARPPRLSNTTKILNGIYVLYNLKWNIQIIKKY